ncbi:MAG TPA: alkane 1-monooxygenase [Steroidobacteraceae bacterium]|nr:alkane 1-monooxygenase [Steroidobacteraceae bacterium]
MAFIAQAADGRTVRYVDGKRYLWLMSLTGPMIPMISVYWYMASGQNPLTLLFPLAYTFLAVPIIDFLMGEDTHNPPEEVVALMSKDNYYRFLLYVAIALLYIDFFVVAWFIGTHALSWGWVIALSLGTGYSSAGAILIGHELGHKNNAADHRASQIVNALVGYGQFCIEHNRGHHVQVSTPEDFASSRMGESIYKFMFREIPGALRRGWGHERERLAKLGNANPWTYRNEILQSWALTAVIAIALIASFGWIMIPFILIHHFYGWYGLTQANYVEHYGLLRAKLPNGRYELCEPRHSWNTNHIYSNLISFHLQRHSDHHANALRPYQALRDFDDLPRLPSGYPGCFGLAAIPVLWFKVMDPKVVAWAGGDITKVNIDPNKKEKLYKKYGQRYQEALTA